MNDLKIFGLPARQGRWLFLPLGITAMLCLGTVYSWSIFRKPLTEALKQQGITIGATETLLPFATLLVVFAILMPIASRYIERYGASKVTAVGGIIVGLGYFLSSFATNIPLLVITYGLIAGAGIGIVYGVPIAVTAKWFPDRKGLAVGFTVVGFGLSPLITAPLAGYFIATYGIDSTFRIFGVAFTAILLAIATQLKFPPADWQPTPQSTAKPASTEPDRLLSSPSFFALWSCYAIGTLAGLMAIGIANNVGNEIIELDPSMATASVSIFAIFNGVGRPMFGWLTDRLKPKKAAILSYVMILIASIVMLNTGKGQVANYFFAFALLWLSLGGWLAIAPTATLSMFNPTNYTKNYGIVFTAYGAGALVGTLVAGSAKDIFGSYTNAFIPTAILSILGILIATFALKPDAKTQQVLS
ncbi:L-lactate MFS transporter [Chamaesiphon polymorphus]|uniref:MFS transporter n=1 Tax=Chamaesiphon polymorphus CCALA 037 TaxID=2107692 RepID=A0A2T1GFH5_9CYAN|nr:OFA family MFS transporter [Chamaesiphon polymorphus]PSB56363.1 MFS transporter [Chamaesiphon polymorphus CCALA 037]